MFDPGFEPYLRVELGFTTNELASNYQVWRAVASSIIPEFYPGILGILGILAEFKRRGGILVVASHSEADFVRRDYGAAVAANGEHVSPDLVFGGNARAKERKPHPFPVIAALDRYGLSRKDVVVVDDMRPGLDMAAAAGVDFAAAGWGNSIPEIRRALQERSRLYCETVVDFSSFLLGSPAAQPPARARLRGGTASP